MEEKQFSYTINGKTYLLKPLVMGQLNQLLTLLKDVEIAEEMPVSSIISIVGEKLSEAFAIILHDPDVSLKTKHIQNLASEISFAPEMTTDLTLRIVEDFFDCTPISLLLKKVNETVEKVSTKISEGVG
jgi:hypothetical protein